LPGASAGRTTPARRRALAEQEPVRKLETYREALGAFVERLKEDRTILAAVLLGTLDETTIWRKDGLALWVIEMDGVTRRLRSDGEGERIWRTFCELGVNLHAELIPRSRFKRMVEGGSRTAFTSNFFARREIVHCVDPSIERWFAEADSLATKDQEKELMVATTWVIHARRWAERVFTIKGDLQLTVEALLWAAHALASAEIVRKGEIYEHEFIYKALEYEPELFKTVYLDVVGREPNAEVLRKALDRVGSYLDQKGFAQLKPLVAYLEKQKRVVPFSEIADHFAHTQLYPWHLEAACEWLELEGRLEKLSAPFKVTKKSRVEVEEPAYFLDA